MPFLFLSKCLCFYIDDRKLLQLRSYVYVHSISFQALIVQTYIKVLLTATYLYAHYHAHFVLFAIVDLELINLVQLTK